MILFSLETTNRYFLVIMVIFIIGSMLGYLLEVLFRRFFSAKKWVNPGFNKGPWLPLYGFGLVIMFALCGLIIKLLPSSMPLYNPNGNLFNNTTKSGATVYDLIPISIMFVSLILLEFIAGIIFVKGFKIRLWDYTNMRGNIMGVICPLFSIFWLIIVLLYYYLINPYIYIGFNNLFKFMFEGGESGTLTNILFIFFIGIIYGIFIIDVIISSNIFSKVVKATKNSKIVKRYEELKKEQNIKNMQTKMKLMDKIPENILEKHKKTKEKINKEKTKFQKFLYKIILIDPDKTKKDNYDENGRPIKDE